MTADAYDLDDRLAEATSEGTRAAIAKHFTGCRSCGKPIVFALTAKGKTMPVDITPVEGGRFLLRQSDPETLAVTKVKFRASYIDAHDLAMYQQRHGAGPIAYTSHFATCVNAKAHRKPR